MFREQCHGNCTRHRKHGLVSSCHDQKVESDHLVTCYFVNRHETFNNVGFGILNSVIRLLRRGKKGTVGLYCLLLSSFCEHISIGLRSQTRGQDDMCLGLNRLISRYGSGTNLGVK